jgi:hypothetical protein
MNKKARKQALKKIAEENLLKKVAQEAAITTQNNPENYGDKVFDLLLENLKNSINIPELDD